MPAGNKTPDPDKQARLHDELRRERELRETSYRARALRIYPHICASCGREFSGKRLRELTVHHKDHDHNHNPPDGSNWELLCLYCHDNEHEKFRMQGRHGGPGPAEEEKPSIANPFDALDTLWKPGEKETEAE